MIIGYIEQWGTGFEKIIALCERSGNEKPIFLEKGGFFQTVFKKSGSPLDPAQNRPITDGLGEQEKKVVEYLSKNSYITIQEIIKLFNVKRSRAKDILVQLVKSILAPEGKGRARKYRLKNVKRSN